MASGKEPRKPHHLSSSKLPPPSVQPLTRSSRLPRRCESKVTRKGAETKRLVEGKRQGQLPATPTHRGPRQRLTPTPLPKAAWVIPKAFLASESRAHLLLDPSLPSLLQPPSSKSLADSMCLSEDPIAEGAAKRMLPLNGGCVTFTKQQTATPPLLPAFCTDLMCEVPRPQLKGLQ